MIEDVDRYIDFMVENDMTANQFLLAYILYLDYQEHNDGVMGSDLPAIANVYKYATTTGGWSTPSMQDLINKGWLKGELDKKKIYPDDLQPTQKFIDAIFASKGDFERFWETYPHFIDHWDDPRQGKIPVKAVSKDEIRDIFNDRVKTKTRFRKLIEALEWAVENDQITMGIKKWLEGEYWKAHLKQKEEGITTRPERVI